jgi:hypothetical protein
MESRSIAFFHCPTGKKNTRRYTMFQPEIVTCPRCGALKEVDERCRCSRKKSSELDSSPLVEMARFWSGFLGGPWFFGRKKNR